MLFCSSKSLSTGFSSFEISSSVVSLVEASSSDFSSSEFFSVVSSVISSVLFVSSVSLSSLLFLVVLLSSNAVLSCKAVSVVSSETTSVFVSLSSALLEFSVAAFTDNSGTFIPVMINAAVSIPHNTRLPPNKYFFTKSLLLSIRSSPVYIVYLCAIACAMHLSYLYCQIFAIDLISNKLFLFCIL